VLKERREPGGKMLAALGLRRVVAVVPARLAAVLVGRAVVASPS
jgi:hypothetical protein